MHPKDRQFSSESEEKRNKASILIKLIWAVWSVFLIVTFIALYTNDWKLFAVSLVGCILLIAPFVLLRQGNVHTSSLIIVLVMIIALTLMSTVGQGIRDVAIIAFPVVFIFAGLTLSRLFYRLYVGLAFVSVIWLSIGETYGWFVVKPLIGEYVNWFYLIYVTIILLHAALAVELLATNLQNNLANAKNEIEQRKQAELEVEKREKRFQALIAHGRDNISLLAEDGTLLWESPSTNSTLGYTPNQFLGGNIFELMHPDDQAWTKELYAYIVQKPGNIREGEFRLFHADGAWRWIECTATNLLDEPSVKAIVLNYRDITERKKAEELLWFQGTHDTLTGIYNRTFFEEELARFERSREFPISVIIGDLDGLKTVNDTKGHATGDELLKQAANVLSSVFRGEDVLARIGGDEFAVLLPKTDFPSVENMVSRIKQRLLEYNRIHPDLRVHISLGAATADTDDLVGTFKLADHRMYADKSKRIIKTNHSSIL